MVTAADTITERCVAIACARLRDWVGLDLTRGGVMSGIERHVAERIATIGEPKTERFSRRLASAASEEGRRLIEAATVPYSWLWRDAGQLAGLRECLVDYPREPLHIWVPACASGEDAYSIAALAMSLGHSISVLGTDVHGSALERARAGRYSAWSCRELPASMRRFFPDDGSGGAVASESLRASVSFDWHSLLAMPRASGGVMAHWDLIVCRNALIYFSRLATQRIVERLASTLKPGGMLVLGSSDTFDDLPPMLIPSQRAGRLVLTRRHRAASQHPRKSPLPTKSKHRHAAAPSIARGMPAPSLRSGCAQAPSIAANDQRLSLKHARINAGELAPSIGRAVRDPLAADRPSQLDLSELLASVQLRIQADVTDAEAQLMAGMVLHMQGQYNQAIICLRAATCLAPGAWVAWYFLALGFEGIGLREEAHRAFRQVGLARGDGSDLPRGSGEFAQTLHAARRTIQRLAKERAKSLGSRTRGHL